VSRIGKKPIQVPDNVKVSIVDRTIKVSGPKGELSWTCTDRVKVAMNGTVLSVERASDLKTDRALHGLTRSLLMNMVTGVSQGYQMIAWSLTAGDGAQNIA